MNEQATSSLFLFFQDLRRKGRHFWLMYRMMRPRIQDWKSTRRGL